MKKVLVVALMRKLVIALWRLVVRRCFAFILCDTEKR